MEPRRSPTGGAKRCLANWLAVWLAQWLTGRLAGLQGCSLANLRGLGFLLGLASWRSSAPLLLWLNGRLAGLTSWSSWLAWLSVLLAAWLAGLLTDHAVSQAGCLAGWQGCSLADLRGLGFFLGLVSWRSSAPWPSLQLQTILLNSVLKLFGKCSANVMDKFHEHVLKLY